MNPLHRSSLAGIVAITLAAVAAAQTGNDNGQFTIKLERPTEVGQKLRVQGEGSQNRTVSIVYEDGARQLQVTNVAIAFDAQADVVEVDETGRPTWVSYTINECVMTSNGEREVVVAPGKRLVARRDANGRTIFEVNGRPLAAPANNALAIVAGLSKGGAADDTVLGTSTPRQIGDTWTIDADGAVNVFNGTNQANPANSPVASGNVTGHGKLVDVMRRGGQDCLVIENRVTTRNMVPGTLGLPAEFTVKNATLTAQIEGLYPTNTRLPPLEQITRLDIDTILAGPIGPGRTTAEVHVRGTRNSRIETTIMSGPGAVATVDEIDTP